MWSGLVDRWTFQRNFRCSVCLCDAYLPAFGCDCKQTKTKYPKMYFHQNVGDDKTVYGGYFFGTNSSYCKGYVFAYVKPKSQYANIERR